MSRGGKTLHSSAAPSHPGGIRKGIHGSSHPSASPPWLQRADPPHTERFSFRMVLHKVILMLQEGGNEERTPGRGGH